MYSVVADFSHIDEHNPLGSISKTPEFFSKTESYWPPHSGKPLYAYIYFTITALFNANSEDTRKEM